MAGPPRKEKLKYIAKDSSEDDKESFLGIVVTLCLTIIISIVSWSFLTTLRLGVEVCSKALISMLESNNSFKWYIFTSVILFGACVRAFLITVARWHNTYGDGTTDSMQNFYDTYNDKNVDKRYMKSTIWQSIQRVIMTFLTLGTGGSGGLEGPAIPIGEGIAAFFAKRANISVSAVLRKLQLVGIASCICALLQSPLTSVIFAAEIVFCGRFIYEPLVYGLIGSLVSYFMNNHFINFEPLYHLATRGHMYTLIEYLEVVMVSILLSIPAGVLLKRNLTFFKRLFLSLPLWMRSPIAALCISGLLYFFVELQNVPPAALVGIGEGMIHELINAKGAEFSIYILCLIVLGKTLVTTLTLMAGGSAGLLIPATFLGAFSGMLVYKISFWLGIALPSSQILYIVAGLVSSLVAIIDIPLTAIVLVIEIFGKTFGPVAILAVCVTYLLASQIKMYKLAGDGH